MRLIDYLDKGASLGPDAPCLTMDGPGLSATARCSASAYRVARGLARRRRRRRAIRSPCCPATIRSPSLASSACRARAAVWCPINPRNEAAENQLHPRRVRLPPAAVSQPTSHRWSSKIRPSLPKLASVVCLDGRDALRARRSTNGSPASDEALQSRADRRSRDAARHRRNHRQAQGRHAAGAQPRSDDRDDADGLSLRGPAGLSRLAPLTHAAGVLVLSDHDARRPHRHHAASPTSANFCALIEALSRYPRVLAADRDLHGCSIIPRWRRPISRRCSASGMARRRYRRRA